MSQTDLIGVETWIFDLDDTLYPSSCGLWELLEPRITDFVERLTGLSQKEAFALQKRYLSDYGLTLRGLMLHHGVDPGEYHASFADVPLDRLTPDPALARALARLPGRRIVFTNSSEDHAQRILRRLGLEGLFDEIFHIGRADFHPKPSREAFAALLADCRVDPRQACFFDDRMANIEAAVALGMTCVLVGEGPDAPFIRHRTSRLAEFLSGAGLAPRAAA